MATVRHLIDLTLRILQEEDDPVDPTEEELVDWYNLSARQVVVAAPDANVVIEPVLLVSGVKQVLPSGSLELGRVIRNMGTNGTTPGDAITPTTVDILQMFDPSWSAATASSAIRHFMKEKGNYWFCTPPSDGTGYVEVETSKVPTAVTYDEAGLWESASVGVDDKYLDPLMHRILAYVFMRDSDESHNEARAIIHYNLFLEGVGLLPSKRMPKG